jgi:hypothetical protein
MVKIRVNTPTEDSCSDELEHYMPSQDPASCKAELDILGTVYQLPPLLSPSRATAQSLKASPRQAHRASISSSFDTKSFDTKALGRLVNCNTNTIRNLEINTKFLARVSDQGHHRRFQLQNR